MMQTESCSCFECQNRHVRFRYRQFLTHSQPGARQLPWISTVRLTLTLPLGGPRSGSPARGATALPFGAKRGTAEKIDCAPALEAALDLNKMRQDLSSTSTYELDRWC
jgi:hypothetical protein